MYNGCTAPFSHPIRFIVVVVVRLLCRTVASSEHNWMNRLVRLMLTCTRNKGAMHAYTLARWLDSLNVGKVNICVSCLWVRFGWYVVLTVSTYFLECTRKVRVHCLYWLLLYGYAAYRLFASLAWLGLAFCPGETISSTALCVIVHSRLKFLCQRAHAAHPSHVDQFQCTKWFKLYRHLFECPYSVKIVSFNQRNKKKCWLYDSFLPHEPTYAHSYMRHTVHRAEVLERIWFVSIGFNLQR